LNIQFGVKVKALEPGKLKSAGVQEGDVITVVNQKPCESVEQLTQFLNAAKGGVYLELVSSSGKKDYIGFGI
jgi:S1-C subfamily serine protease